MKEKNVAMLIENKKKILEKLGSDYLTAQEILQLVFKITPCTFNYFNGDKKYCDGRIVAPILQSLVYDELVERKLDKTQNKIVYRKRD